MASPVSTTALVIQLMEEVMHSHQLDVIAMILIYLQQNRRRLNQRSVRAIYGRIKRIPDQVRHINRLVNVSDVACLENLRMDRNAFGRLCRIFRQTGDLTDGRFVKVEEQVALFLSILAHHKKNRVVKFDFLRSGYTVSRYVHRVLRAVIRLQASLLATPEPITDDCTDNRWKWFKGCLGALDGTYISLHVPQTDKPRYRSRKGQICTNTLAVCDRDMKFVYVLPGWEGSAGDARVLRDAVNRPNGLKVPRGNYYLCDNGYANSDGFLTPFKGVRYHLKEWGPATEAPQSPREIFNMRHTRARNVIERAFAVLKMRWGILRSAAFYPVKVQIRLIMACFLLHNYVRGAMLSDPIELAMDGGHVDNDLESEAVENEFVDTVEPTTEWNTHRDALAQSMWNVYTGAPL
ncbi:protein ALP1-like [Salvia hispanica]|uniref:protein ALP1-like n=1 Tax=Salvia hispanica TaxID=49212 RepID=UPI0020098E71|nr:protein ALP1-like [Salvia hispanica]